MLVSRIVALVTTINNALKYLGRSTVSDLMLGFVQGHVAWSCVGDEFASKQPWLPQQIASYESPKSPALGYCWGILAWYCGETPLCPPNMNISVVQQRMGTALVSFAVSVGQNGLELTCPTSASENAPRCTSSTSSSSPGRQALIKAFQVKTFSRTSRVAMLANNLKIQGKLDHDTEKKIVPTGTDCPGCDQYFSSSCSCMFDRVCASFSWLGELLEEIHHVVLCWIMDHEWVRLKTRAAFSKTTKSIYSIIQ